MNKVPINSLIILIFIFALIWVVFNMGKISLNDAIIISISSMIGGYVGYVFVEQKEKR